MLAQNQNDTKKEEDDSLQKDKDFLQGVSFCLL
jgi:hypothetical protein